MAATCLIQLGRTGDVLNVLPLCVRNGWALTTRPEYAAMAEGAGVAVDRWEGGIEDPASATEHAAKRYERVVVTQLFGRGGRNRERACAQYCLEEWHRAGCLDSYGKWPLAFPARDAGREAGLWRRHDDGRPMLLLSLDGISGPFRDAAWFAGEVRGRWGGRFNIVHLPDARAAVFYDLLGLYDRAALLVTIDTSTLHLCWASSVPAVQLLSYEPEDWHGSTPKGNCVFHCKYREARDRIADIHRVIESHAG